MQVYISVDDVFVIKSMDFHISVKLLKGLFSFTRHFRGVTNLDKRKFCGKDNELLKWMIIIQNSQYKMPNKVIVPNIGQILLNTLINWLGSREKCMLITLAGEEMWEKL